ncbi:MULTISPECIES: bifunctional adenosylcobinamide kinase/adenosylcobinamide-phosphate guanylyltransferase [unclassified Leptospira]|uniref:bifunctional adenosylcobinamide kinase/adenosylcobinamide-phosphate guanylyltransferase n=1 Tax=unclassified Leptospira TaxID=2633828 RepID=UPI0002BFF2BB|nr:MULTISPECIES: bifunctional adenosylcobinamide kinase/adenosylcobinamide-phosphate guanylyltransferase [unclassified Leptospira]EMK01803.1 adenosylcobinamide kinase/adenosylcobinamidephosphate guanylyltransferase [Leptospira sp. B5-022]MCR1795160.1 bifunctional adenosylcobinamide kinase/adenosylcobinamide-phosphate guanylyltransferase [Leptospira sp. id769339]
MAGIILVTGGCRSGKSRFALEKANSVEGKKFFLATCPHIDSEIDERIQRHKQERTGWDTIEEELDLSSVFDSIPSGAVVLLDCLSLWINNLMYAAKNKNSELTQDHIKDLCRKLGEHILNSNLKTVFLVTNEVGMGLVPENKEGRLYRDLLGICNQTFALMANEVYLLVSGISIRIKPHSETNL